MKGSKLLDNVREVIRTNHFSYSTEKTYIGWIYRYILFHNKRQIEKVKIRLEESMLLKEFAGASIPEALERKYPNAPKELAWQNRRSIAF